MMSAAASTLVVENPTKPFKSNYLTTAVVRRSTRYFAVAAVGEKFSGVGFRGQAPPRCPLCNSPWLIEELADEVAA